MSVSAPRRLLATVLRPFTKVEPQEVTLVALMTLTSFLLLTGYYLLKVVREPLILSQAGAEGKLYSRAGQTVLMIAFVHLYGELAKRVGRRRLLLFVFSFFISNLAVFAVLARAGVEIGIAFFLWVGLFSYTVVAQFWGLAADIYTEEQGKRLFPIIGGGSSVGALAGASLARGLMPFGPHVLMGSAVIVLVVCVSMIWWVERHTADQRAAEREAAGQGSKAEAPPPEKPLSAEGAFRLLARDRYLLLIAGMAIALNWVNSSGEYLLDRTLLATSTDKTFIGNFKAEYSLWYNLLGVGLQLLVVSRVLKYVGVRRALFLMPGFSMVGYAVAAFMPVLRVVQVVKIGENSLQYSLQDTTRHALFLVTSRVEKFVGKTAVDTIAVRLGSVMSAIVVWLGTRYGMPVAAFAALNVALTMAWMGFAVAIGREHRRREGREEAPAAAQPAAA
jgi:ATP:ADP antiporter, AAA family